MTSGVNAVPEPHVSLHGCRLGRSVWVRAWSDLTDCVLADDVFVGYRCVLARARVGRGAMIATGARVGVRGGPPVTLGENCWVGVRAVVDPGVSLGRNTIIAAGCHVTTDIDSNLIVYGARQVPRPVVGDPSAEPVDTVSTVEMVGRRPDLYRAPWPPGAVVGPECLNDADIAGGQELAIGRATVIMGRRLGSPGVGGAILGQSVRVGRRCVLECSGGLEIGDHTKIGDDVVIVTSGHDYHQPGLPRTACLVRIGAGARIGGGATLVGPLTIGTGATVLPGHIVIKDIPDHGVSAPITSTS